MSDEDIQESQDQPQEATLTPTAAPTQPNWREMLSEDIRGDERLAKFETLEGLAKSYINAEQMIGREKIPMPKSDEEWQDVYNRLGRPESAEGYGLAGARVGDHYGHAIFFSPSLETEASYSPWQLKLSGCPFFQLPYRVESLQIRTSPIEVLSQAPLGVFEPLL